MRGGTDRRQHKRYAVQDGAMVILKPFPIRLGRVMGISRGGVEVRYYEKERWADSFQEASILLAFGNIQIDNLPIKTIADFEIEDKFSEFVEKRKRCMAFGSLTPVQTSLIEELIRKHTILSFEDRRRIQP